MVDVLRYTKQIGPDHWITECRICRKRYGRKGGPTEQFVDEWWAKHVTDAYHLRTLEHDGALTPQEQLLHAIFGTEPAASAKPSERSGEVIVREGARFRSNDNPRGNPS